MLKYLILRYVQVIFTLFLKQILGIIIILITWSYVLQDIFVDLEMTGMDEVMFRPPHPLKFSPKALCFLCQFQGNMSRGGTAYCLGGQQERLPQGDGNLSPSTLQGKLYKGSGPLTPWGQVCT